MATHKNCTRERITGGAWVASGRIYLCRDALHRYSVLLSASYLVSSEGCSADWWGDREAVMWHGSSTQLPNAARPQRATRHDPCPPAAGYSQPRPTTPPTRPATRAATPPHHPRAP